MPCVSKCIETPAIDQIVVCDYTPTPQTHTMLLCHVLLLLFMQLRETPFFVFFPSSPERESVCVCVWERERERVCIIFVCVCMYVCMLSIWVCLVMCGRLLSGTCHICRPANPLWPLSPVRTSVRVLFFAATRTGCAVSEHWNRLLPAVQPEPMQLLVNDPFLPRPFLFFHNWIYTTIL